MHDIMGTKQRRHAVTDDTPCLDLSTAVYILQITLQRFFGENNMTHSTQKCHDTSATEEEVNQLHVRTAVTRMMGLMPQPELFASKHPVG